ncbi:MAG: DM13 domain-containing protein [Chloroflexi bacterium]|nr:DM13 domain-containing protein [Chloroflexota bacterium]
MTRLLLKLPWFISAPAVVALALVLAVGGNYILGSSFARTFLDETDPLATAPLPDDGQAARDDLVDPGDDGGSASGSVLATGEFMDTTLYSGSGTAKVIQAADGSLVLRFEDFSVSGGPDLFVIMTTDPDGGSSDDGLEIDRLRATDGNINYDIPPGTDVSQYESVIIFCKRLGITFSVATLEVFE